MRKPSHVILLSLPSDKWVSRVGETCIHRRYGGDSETDVDLINQRPVYLSTSWVPPSSISLHFNPTNNQKKQKQKKKKKKRETFWFHVSSYIYVCPSFMSAHTNTGARVHIHKSAHTHTYTHTLVHTHNTLTRIHTCTQQTHAHHLTSSQTVRNRYKTRSPPYSVSLIYILRSIS